MLVLNDDCGEILRELSCDDDELDPANSGDPGITFDSIKAGEQYDVLDSMDKWCEAEVRSIDRIFVENMSHHLSKMS